MSDTGGTTPGRVLVLACGALAREILDVVRINGWHHVKLECLPVGLHNRPEKIPAAVERRLATAVREYDRILVGYADCGTGGLLDPIVARYGATRLPGAHCYEFFATSPRFAVLSGGEIGTLYLTDYLVKHFDRLVMGGLGIAAHPELRDQYFGNYTKMVHLAQTDDPALDRKAREAAATLGLTHERLHTGYGELQDTLVGFVRSRAAR